MPTLPGFQIWESTALAVGTVLSGFFDTSGYDNLLINAVITNSTGTTTLTVEGSFDGANQDTTMPYSPAITASTPAGGTTVVTQHQFVRFRIVQATAPATVATVSVKSKA